MNPSPQTVAEWLNLPNEHSSDGVSEECRQRRHLLYKALDSLSAEEIHILLNLTSAEPLVPLALQKLHDDCGLLELLAATLKQLDYPWIERSEQAHSLRRVVESALAELGQWDGAPAIVDEATLHRLVILEAWVNWERNFSRIT